MNEQKAYPAGSVTLKSVDNGRSVVIVRWEPGATLSSEEMRLLLPMFTKLIGDGRGTTKLIAIHGPDRKPVDTLLFDPTRPISN